MNRAQWIMKESVHPESMREALRFKWILGNGGHVYAASWEGKGSPKRKMPRHDRAWHV